MSVIKIDLSITTPVYKQIIHSIHKGIDKGVLKHGDVLPSVNQIAGQFSLSRGSVFTAYNQLKASGIIDAIPGKGYFVAGTQVAQEQNIFLLFSTFTPYKEILYNSFLNNLSEKSTVDIFFHDHNIKIFETLIREQAGYYNTFVIMPEINKKTPGILKLLQDKKVYILDVGWKEYGKLYPGIFQNFEKDTYGIFSKNITLFKKYKKLLLIFPSTNKTQGIIAGFKKFANQNNIPAQIINAAPQHKIKKGDCFVIIDDKDLVHIIKEAKTAGLKLGRDIGIISYNETELKSIIAEGITTITTDFEYMGKRLAEMILNGETVTEENPFLIIKRKSF